MRPDHFGKALHRPLAKAVVLHGKFLKVGVQVYDADDGLDGFPRQVIPGDVEEL